MTDISWDTLKLRCTARKENRWHHTTDAPIGGSVIIEEGESKPSANGRDIVHHVAFRAADDDELNELREKVIKMGLSPSQVIDRHWFHSVDSHIPKELVNKMKEVFISSMQKSQSGFMREWATPLLKMKLKPSEG